MPSILRLMWKSWTTTTTFPFSSMGRGRQEDPKAEARPQNAPRLREREEPYRFFAVEGVYNLLEKASAMPLYKSRYCSDRLETSGRVQDPSGGATAYHPHQEGAHDRGYLSL